MIEIPLRRKYRIQNSKAKRTTYRPRTGMPWSRPHNKGFPPPVGWRRPTKRKKCAYKTWIN